MVNKNPKTQDPVAFGSDDEPISRLLRDLRRVQAPNDFDFRVKARIASGKPSTSTASWLPASVRLAVPLGLLLLVGGYFALTAIYSPSDIGVPAVAVQPSNPAPVVDTPPNNGVAPPANEMRAEDAVLKSSETTATSGTPARQKKIASSGLPVKPAGGGSFDEALRTTRGIYPPGLDPNDKTAPIANSSAGETQVSTREVLNLIGIKAAFSEAGWKVESVDKAAERSGVKAGDVIEALNGQPLAEKSAFGSKIKGKRLRVRREGRSIQINLKP